jgi:hypothetical protein
MGHMPAIPRSTRDSLTWRLILHAEEHWPQLKEVQVTCRASFAYAAGILPGGEKIPLFRLRYGGSAHSFGFAIYSAARDRYEDALLLNGHPTGTPQEALDTACTVHLAGIGHQPESRPLTNLRVHPLRVSGYADASAPPNGCGAPTVLPEAVRAPQTGTGHRPCAMDRAGRSPRARGERYPRGVCAQRDARGAGSGERGAGSGGAAGQRSWLTCGIGAMCRVTPAQGGQGHTKR